MGEIDYRSEDYTDTYLDLLSDAFERSKILGFGSNPSVTTKETIDEQSLVNLQKYAYDELFPSLYSLIPFYWGNSCQLLSVHAFAILRAKGFDAELIIGEVDIGGTLEFDTNVDILRHEMESVKAQSGGQELHVWVSLGADVIVDCGLPDRMIKNYRFPEKYMPPIMVDTACNLSRKFKARHQPMILGADFLAKTNDLNTVELVRHYRKNKPGAIK